MQHEKEHMTQMPGCLIVAADVSGDVVVAHEGLSFWGGVDPDTGVVIDAHHHLHGASLADKFLLMPTSRGSCSGSEVLLELALNGHAPAALIFKEDEEILSLGALIADTMFERQIAVIRLTAIQYAEVARQPSARLEGNKLTAGPHTWQLQSVAEDALDLTASDIAVLNGDKGQPAALAMKVITSVAASQGAKRLRDVTRGHIDGCIYAHPANLKFAAAMAEMGAKVAIPTTINAISVERDRWQTQGLPEDFGSPANQLAEAYVRMGVAPTFTCAPYLLDDVPALGEDIGWSESNAVIYANSVLGARTAKHPDYLDLFIAMTGRAPLTGVYVAENRRPRVNLNVDQLGEADDALWPLLGWVAGRLSPDKIPLLTGVKHLLPSRDDLRGLCAAFGTTSAAPMLHVAGVTPECDLSPEEGAEVLSIKRDDLKDVWAQFNEGPSEVDLIALGSPHFSLEETRRFAELLGGQTVRTDVAVIITLGRHVRELAGQEGLLERLETAGVQVMSDLCWCSIVEPVFPPEAAVLMTNSGKYAHYAPGLSGRRVRYGSLADCAQTALTGVAPSQSPAWLD